MITKAIIPVAGWGVRRLPITKTIEKCMLPIGNRPLIDYIVQDCIKAGITEFIFAVGEQSTQLQEYYRSNIPLNDYLRRNGKQDMLDIVAPLKGIKLHYVVQPGHGKRGTAVPVAIASEYVKPGESVAVVMGDDFFYNADGSSEMKRLVDGTPEGENGMLGAVLAKDDTITGRYGSVEEDENGYLIRVNEHPDVAPEPFVKNVSRYILNYETLQAVRSYVESGKPDEVSGEYFVFEPFAELISRGIKMKVIHSVGQYLDGGTVESWLHANQVVVGSKKVKYTYVVLTFYHVCAYIDV